MKYSKSLSNFMLDLARKAIDYYLENRRELEIEKESVPKELTKKAATFVTLTKNGHLRGCIGHLEAYSELYRSIISNSVAAAFFDPRFDPVTKNEAVGLSVEISVLGEFRHVTSFEELKKGDGVVLIKGRNRAVFLPQVWEELPEKEEFLKYLAVKAGLSEDGWKEAEYEVFEVEVIK